MLHRLTPGPSVPSPPLAVHVSAPAYPAALLLRVTEYYTRRLFVQGAFTHD